MRDFSEVRGAIDLLIDQTRLSIKTKSASDSMKQVAQAQDLLQKLKQMSTSEQSAIVTKREWSVAALAISADKLSGKGKASKKAIIAENATA